MYVRMYVHLLTYNMYVNPITHMHVHSLVYMSVHCYDLVHTVQYMYKCVPSTNVVYQVPTYQGIH